VLPATPPIVSAASTSQPVLTPPPATAKHQWFVSRQNGREQGPYTAAQLKTFVSKELLVPDDFIRRGDLKSPVKAASVKGLFTASQNAVPASTASSKNESVKLMVSRTQGVPPDSRCATRLRAWHPERKLAKVEN
jgi:hypothetical protein